MMMIITIIINKDLKSVMIMLMVMLIMFVTLMLSDVDDDYVNDANHDIDAK